MTIVPKRKKKMVNTGMKVEQLKFDLWRLVLIPPHDNEIRTIVVAAANEDQAKEYFNKMVKVMGEVT